MTTNVDHKALPARLHTVQVGDQLLLRSPEQQQVGVVLALAMDGEGDPVVVFGDRTGRRVNVTVDYLARLGATIEVTSSAGLTADITEDLARGVEPGR